eukprot:17855-Pelagomonas_calceolata.AAC.1
MQPEEGAEDALEEGGTPVGMQWNIACFRLHAHKLRVETSLWQHNTTTSFSRLFLSLWTFVDWRGPVTGFMEFLCMTLHACFRVTSMF